MCGRFTISKTELELEKRFQADFYSKVLQARYNIAPTQLSAVITGAKPDEIQLYRWGLIPFWAKSPAIGAKMINARSETVREKPAFKQSMKKRRCLVLADGWYEWKREKKDKIPHRIKRVDGEAFAMAGLWASWNPAGKDEEWDPEKTIHSFTVLTRDALPKIADIHDRMPVMLTPESERLWIDEELSDAEVGKLIQPFDADLIDYYTVSTDVNSTRNERPDLLEEKTFSKPGEQTDLFG